jgi:hypothetical protein
MPYPLRACAPAVAIAHGQCADRPSTIAPARKSSWHRARTRSTRDASSTPRNPSSRTRTTDGDGAFESASNVEIRVERDDRPILATRVRDEILIGSGGHADLAGVDYIEAPLTQRDGRSARQTLIEQQPHALFGNSSTLSSSAVAA